MVNESYVNQKLAPVVSRLSKVETEMAALGEAIKKVEKQLVSTDMKSQRVLDRIEYARLDIMGQHQAITNEVKNALKSINNMKAAAKAKRSGVIRLGNSSLGVKASDFDSDTASRTINNDDEYRKYMSIQSMMFRRRMEGISKRNNQMTQNISDLTMQVNQWPQLKNSFKSQYSVFTNIRDEEVQNFSNDRTSKVDTGEAVNSLNSYSKDFSNHVGDMKSQVSSLDWTDCDFNSNDNLHIRQLPWDDVDFANEKLSLDKDMADFKDIQINFSKTPSKSLPKPKKNLLSRIMSFFSFGRGTMGSKPYKWYGGNQYMNTSTHARTWQGANQYMNSASTEFINRYKSRGRGTMGSFEDETMGYRRPMRIRQRSLSRSGRAEMMEHKKRYQEARKAIMEARAKRLEQARRGRSAAASSRASSRAARRRPTRRLRTMYRGRG